MNVNVNESTGTAVTTLAALDRLRDRVRRDRRPASVPLAFLAAAATVVAGLEWLDRQGAAGPAGVAAHLFWVVAAPVVFVLVARRYRILERDTGVAAGHRTYGRLAVAAVVSAVVLPVLAFPMGIPYALLGSVLLGVAGRRRSAYLAVGAVVFGAGGLLQSQFVLSNRLQDLAGGYAGWAPAAAWAGLALLLAALAAAARRHEAAS